MAQDINIKIGANITDLQKKLSKAQRSLERSGKKMSSIGNDLIMTISAPLAALGGSALKAAGDFEAMSNGLTSIMGDADAAAAELEKLKEAAKNPGLGFQQAVTGSVRLQSIGISAEMARENMLAMGNAIGLVGGGAAELDRATLAIQQIGAKGKVSAEEINQLNEVIPQIRAVMKDAFGTSDTQELAKMGVDANTFIEGITSGLQKLPKAQGGIKNAIENAGIAMTSFLSDLGMQLNDAFNIQGKVDGFAETLSGLTEKFGALDEGTKRFIFTLSGVALALGPLIKMIGVSKLMYGQLLGNVNMIVGVFGKLQAVTKMVAAGQLTLNTILAANPIGVVVVAVAALGAALYLLYQNSETARTAMDALFNNVLKPAFNLLLEIGKVIIDVFKGVFNALVNTGKAIFSVYQSIIQGIVEVVQRIPVIGKIATFLQKVFRTAVLVITKIFQNLPAVFAGVAAEARSTGDKVISFFEKIAINAQIIAKKVQKAMTLDGDARKALQKSINQLAAKKKDLEKEGKAFGVAFKEAFNAEMNTIEPPKIADPKSVSFGGSVAPASDFSFTAPTGGGAGDISGTAKRNTEAIREQTEAVQQNAVALTTLETKQFQVSGSAMSMANSTLALESGMRNFKAVTEEMKAVLTDFNAGVTDLVNTGLADLAGGLAEGIGGMMNGTANLKTVAGGMLSTIGGMLMQLGKLAIQTGIAISGIQVALKSLNPVVAIAGGVALVALAKLVQGKAAGLSESGQASLPAFANGGLIDKPTLGMFGEAGPEALIPKKRLDSLLSGYENGGGGGFVAKTVIRGNDLEVILDKTKRRNDRVR